MMNFSFNFEIASFLPPNHSPSTNDRSTISRRTKRSPQTARLNQGTIECPQRSLGTVEGSDSSEEGRECEDGPTCRVGKWDRIHFGRSRVSSLSDHSRTISDFAHFPIVSQGRIPKTLSFLVVSRTSGWIYRPKVLKRFYRSG